METSHILNDKREISQIFWPGESGENIEVGIHGVEKIVPYCEATDGDPVWLAIYRNGKITQRVSLKYIDTVFYLRG